ncbi:MAG: 30S ribosomal protein S16 [Thermogutta sp.]|nr:30S ribosomal protein S16 [Thermogutta sp.]
MKKMGRKHRPFFRICATDARSPRDGRVIEELGTYDPMIPETDARVTLNGERIQYWLGVGAQPSEKVAVLIKKYGPNGTHLQQQKEAVERLQQKRATRRAAAQQAAALAGRRKALREGTEEEADSAPAEEGYTD